jgi:hypothetical protein
MQLQFVQQEMLQKYKGDATTVDRKIAEKAAHSDDPVCNVALLRQVGDLAIVVCIYIMCGR